MGSVNVNLLAWRPGAIKEAFFQERFNYRITRVAAQIAFVLSGLNGMRPEEVNKVKNSFAALPESGLKNILKSPNIYHAFTARGPSSDMNAFKLFAAAVDAEHARLGSTVLDEDLWTALGDARFSAPDGRKICSSPRLSNGIVVDFRSDSYKYQSDFICRTPFESHARHEDEAIHGLLQNAIDYLEENAKRTYDFVSSMVEVILPAKDKQIPETQRKVRSISNRGFVGRIVLLNLDAPSATPEVILESIVHEAIHSYLYSCEEEVSWLNRNEYEEPAFKVISPWTGNLIYFSSYLHACFVWFSLACFWRHIEGLDASFTLEAERLLQRSLRGFAEQKYLGPLNETDIPLPDELTDCLRSLGDRLWELS